MKNKHYSRPYAKGKQQQIIQEHAEVEISETEICSKNSGQTQVN